jgi:hypothetical protein
MQITIVIDGTEGARLERLADAISLLAGRKVRTENTIDIELSAADLAGWKGRDHELHEAGPLTDITVPHSFTDETIPGSLATDLPPPGTFTQAELDANDLPFAPAAGASNTSAPPVNLALTNGSAVKLDTDGLPWDERIHSSNRKLASNGKWWAKRGVDDQTRLKVEAELRAVLGPLTSVEGSVDPTRAPVPPPTPAPIAGTPPPPPPPPVRTEPPFPLFVKALNLHNNDKTKTRIETLTINEAIAAMGIAPAVLPTMAQQQHWSRLGELAQMLGLEGVA